MKSQSTRAARYNGDLAVDGEDAGKIVQFDLFFGGHFAIGYEFNIGVVKGEIWRNLCVD